MWTGLFLLLLAFSCVNVKALTDRELSLKALEEEVAKTSIVVYKKNLAKGRIAKLEKKLKLSCTCDIERLSTLGAFILHYKESNHIGVNKMKKIKGVSSVSEDFIVHASRDEQERQSSIPNDPLFRKQWALQKRRNEADINFQEGWQAYIDDAQGGDPNGPSVVVAVLDTGIDYNHPDLKDAMWKNPGEIPGNGRDDDENNIDDDVYGADFTTGQWWNDWKPLGDPIDRQGHGTHCAGVIAASTNNRLGVSGIAGMAKNKVKLMAVKTLNDYGVGPAAWALKGLEYAINKGAKISSNSYGGGSLDGKLLRILNRVPHHLFVAAAGNNGKRLQRRDSTCGANAPNQICVGASTKRDRKYWDDPNDNKATNYGKPYVHVMAPGKDILSTLPNNHYGEATGTSMACPQVAGLAAVLMTLRDQLTPVQVKQLIESNVQPKSQYRDMVTSGGLIDVYKSVKAATQA